VPAIVFDWFIFLNTNYCSYSDLVTILSSSTISSKWEKKVLKNVSK